MGKWDFGKVGFLENGILGRLLEKWDFWQLGIGEIWIWRFFLENGFLGKWILQKGNMRKREYMRKGIFGTFWKGIFRKI